MPCISASSGVDLDARLGIGIVQRRVARHRPAVPVLQHAPGRQDEGELVVGLFHHGDEIQAA